jgi:glycosyltransferase involved in cell wall biosynthesis
MSDGLPRLSLVIPTYGRADILRDTLDSLLECDPLPSELIVVDGHPEGSAEAVVTEFGRRANGMPVRYEATPKGASVQRNIGIDLAVGDVIVFTDDDVHYDRRVFGVLAEAHRDPGLAGATGQIHQEWRSVGNQRSLVRRLLDRGSEGRMTSFGYPRRVRDGSVDLDVESMQGCLMSARRDLAAEVRFDESLGRPDNYALLEDEEFSYRLSRRGRLRHLADAVVEHRNMGFHNRDPRYFSWLVVVDRAYIFRKNFPQTARAKAGFAALLVVLTTHRILNREWAGVRGIVEGTVQAWRDVRQA